MEMGDIYGLLRRLGLSAENTRFFHVSYAVYLTTRQPVRTPFAEWWLYPAVAGQYHLYFQRKAQRLHCGESGVGNRKRSAEIHHEVSLEARASSSEFIAILAAYIKSGDAA